MTATIYRLLPSERRGWIVPAETVNLGLLAAQERARREAMVWDIETEAEHASLMASFGFSRDESQEIVFDVKPTGCRCADVTACQFVADGRCPLLEEQP